ncbi:MAG TPA: CAP domain-containing protein [Longimicrobiales bacterium]|nr:CAP domain-containing protein [Longimicrobiales bacterium]
MVRALTAALALVLGACALPGSTVAPAGMPAGAPPCPATRGQLVVDRINVIRLDRGLRPLAIEERLVRAALAHTADQAGRGAAGVGHVGSDGSAPGDRLTAAGYTWRLVAENVAAGIPSAEAVVAGWMDSPPHRATILSPDAVHAGVGYVYRLDGGPSHYWTLVVAAPRDAADARLLACHP